MVNIFFIFLFIINFFNYNDNFIFIIVVAWRNAAKKHADELKNLFGKFVATEVNENLYNNLLARRKTYGEKQYNCYNIVIFFYHNIVINRYS